MGEGDQDGMGMANDAASGQALSETTARHQHHLPTLMAQDKRLQAIPETQVDLAHSQVFSGFVYIFVHTFLDSYLKLFNRELLHDFTRSA